MNVKEEDEDLKTWCEIVGGIIVDAMLDAKLVKEEEFKEATQVASMELFVRLIIGDYPPPCKPKQLEVIS